MRTAYDTKRHVDNLDLCAILLDAVNAQPTARFSQLLINVGFVTDTVESGLIIGWKDEFYTEPSEVLARVKKLMEVK